MMNVNKGSKKDKSGCKIEKVEFLNKKAILKKLKGRKDN